MRIWFVITFVYLLLFLTLGVDIYKNRLKNSVNAIRDELAYDIATSQKLRAQKKIEMLKSFGFINVELTTVDFKYSENFLNSKFLLSTDGFTSGFLIDTPDVFTMIKFIFSDSYLGLFFYSFYVITFIFILVPLYRYKKSIQSFIESCKENKQISSKNLLKDSVINEILNIYDEKIAYELKVHSLQYDLEKKSALTQLAKQVAHDIRSPLSVLNLVSHRINSLESEEKEMLTQVSARINAIANNLLDQSKLLKLQPILLGDTAVDISEIIEKIIFEKKFQYQNVHVIEFVEKSDLNYLALVDENNFAAIVSNLINNSVDSFGSAPGEIVVEIDRDRSHIVVTVIDNGCGITQENLLKIGSEGFTFGKLGLKNSGMGLGLNSAIHAIESIGGNVSVSSTQNIGTRILIKIPVLLNA